MSKRFMPIGAKPEDPSYLAGWLCEPHPVNVRSNNIPIQKQSGGIPPSAVLPLATQLCRSRHLEWLLKADGPLEGEKT